MTGHKDITHGNWQSTSTLMCTFMKSTINSVNSVFDLFWTFFQLYCSQLYYKLTENCTHVIQSDESACFNGCFNFNWRTYTV